MSAPGADARKVRETETTGTGTEPVLETRPSENYRDKSQIPKPLDDAHDKEREKEPWVVLDSEMEHLAAFVSRLTPPPQTPPRTPQSRSMSTAHLRHNPRGGGVSTGAPHHAHGASAPMPALIAHGAAGVPRQSQFAKFDMDGEESASRLDPAADDDLVADHLGQRRRSESADSSDLEEEDEDLVESQTPANAPVPHVMGSKSLSVHDSVELAERSLQNAANNEHLLTFHLRAEMGDEDGLRSVSLGSQSPLSVGSGKSMGHTIDSVPRAGSAPASRSLAASVDVDVDANVDVASAFAATDGIVMDAFAQTLSVQSSPVGEQQGTLLLEGWPQDASGTGADAAAPPSINTYTEHRAFKRALEPTWHAEPMAHDVATGAVHALQPARRDSSPSRGVSPEESPMASPLPSPMSRDPQPTAVARYEGQPARVRRDSRVGKMKRPVLECLDSDLGAVERQRHDGVRRPLALGARSGADQRNQALCAVLACAFDTHTRRVLARRLLLGPSPGRGSAACVAAGGPGPIVVCRAGVVVAAGLFCVDFEQYVSLVPRGRAGVSARISAHGKCVSRSHLVH